MSTLEPGRVVVGAHLVDAFPRRQGTNCGSSALCDLLAFHGLSYGSRALSEEMVFGLSGGLGFVYVEVPGHTPPPPPLFLNGRASDLERDLCHNLDVGLDLRRTADGAEAWRWIEAEIAADRPTMIWADLKLLDYVDVQVHQTFHNVVVLGFDKSAGAVWVSDHGFAEPQRCSAASLARARNSTALPGPNENGTFVMTFPEVLPPAPVAIHRGIQRAVANMREGSHEPSPALAGLAAVRTFTDSFPEWPDRFGEGLGWALKGLRFFITRAGNDGALFRSMQARFLGEASEILGDPALRHASWRYEALATRWARVAALLRGPDAVAQHRLAVPEVGCLAQLEHEATSVLASWL